VAGRWGEESDPFQKVTSYEKYLRHTKDGRSVLLDTFGKRRRTNIQEECFGDEAPRSRHSPADELEARKSRRMTQKLQRGNDVYW